LVLNVLMQCGAVSHENKLYQLPHSFDDTLLDGLIDSIDLNSKFRYDFHIHSYLSLARYQRPPLETGVMVTFITPVQQTQMGPLTFVDVAPFSFAEMFL
uniref:DUF4255 domain-containing protein n=1 Tax=Haemonchus placei TaxID=6290 RepID=A0A0N4WDN4_HAEPC